MSNAICFLDELKKRGGVPGFNDESVGKSRLISFEKSQKMAKIKKRARGGIQIDDLDFEKIVNDFIESLQSSQNHLARLKRKVLDCGKEKDNVQTRLLLAKFNELYRMTNGMLNL